MAAIQRLTLADQLVVVVRTPGQAWRRMLDWPLEAAPSRLLGTFFGAVPGFADQVKPGGAMVLPLDAREGPAAGNFVIGVRLNLQQEEECVLIGVISEINEAGARESGLRLALGAEVPLAFQREQAARQARADVEKLAAVLDVTATVGGETRFLAAALAVCNGLATRFQCDRVSLGWLSQGFVHLCAVSRTEHFDRRMAAAQALEAAMEEAMDQNEEIVWPPSAGASTISRDHQRFADEQKVRQLCSVPVRRGDEPLGVITCERQAGAFTDAEVRQLRLTFDLAGPRLADLKERDRWFGARWAAATRARAASLLGPEHTWAKILALTLCGILALLVFLRVPYRVDGSFVLRSDQLAYLAAPFDGFIDQVPVRPGDTVKAGDPLLILKTTELELEQSFAAADLNRHQREAEKARAAGAMADMRIAESLARQAAVRLDLVRHRIREATIRSPFDGVVIEGDLRERLGSPVKTADILLKVAQVDALYVESAVNERDVHEILGKTRGEIAFVTQPKHTFPVRIVTIEQAAVPKADGNVFLVRCAIEGGAEPWWRPGMSGVCKIAVGKRNLLWIISHRTVDFFRLKLWW